MRLTTDIISFCRPMIAYAAILCLLGFSCQEKHASDPDQSKVIPEKTLVSILTDFYIADGLLSLPDIRSRFASRDSVLNYIDIIKSYGYSYDEMNSTINYYLGKRPKELVKIFDRAFGNLSEMESRYHQEATVIQEASRNFWTGRTEYAFPDTSASQNPDFSFIIDPPNTFTLEFTVLVFLDDQSAGPGFFAWLSRADSVDSGEKKYLPEIRYLKDGQPHKFTITEEIKGSAPVILKGSLFNCQNNPGPGGINAIISEISYSLLTPSL